MWWNTWYVVSPIWNTTHFHIERTSREKVSRGRKGRFHDTRSTGIVSDSCSVLLQVISSSLHVPHVFEMRRQASGPALGGAVCVLREYGYRSTAPVLRGVAICWQTPKQIPFYGPTHPALRRSPLE